MKDVNLRSISFKDLNISSRRVSLTMHYDNTDHEIWYEFDREIETTSSLVAIAVAPLCGRAFDEVSFDFEIDGEALESIRSFTRADVSAPTKPREPQRDSEDRDGTILSFSGGFDSIAAKALLPDDTHLVSLDLGGWFKREAEYFGRFNPITIKTNIRQVPDQRTALTSNNWLFMATGTILCSYHLGAKYHVFGTILGERFSFPASPRKIPLMESIGLQEAPITSGITEIGTTRIMLQTHPEEVAASLQSLANNGDRKQYYKQSMVTLLAEELGVKNPISDFNPEWKNKVGFGGSYTTALSALYFMAKGRMDLIAPLYDEIPAEAVTFSKSHRMDFMTRVNTDFYHWTPRHLRNPLFEKLSNLDLVPYSESDWDEVHETREFLKKWF
ncbi:hypothetical protein COCCU_12895 [Corynebacterium occultum]|uniref:Uncharacterized protein n=1 Tax=Corynebacterium occultum TaxID=2675219 RepID=A0A6B8WQE4_9CORY|nr:hypothetical protein [Corynebacterium occultum]QGU08478.1 hypothetical protein COCCU_12895 [Corynebacterium occultum]